MDDSPPVPPPPPSIVIAASCLGRLGRWGNQVFQWGTLKLSAELHGGRLLCPDWPGRHVLVRAALLGLEPACQVGRSACVSGLFTDTFGQVHAALDELLTSDGEALPLCADRPMLSHAGWRAWAQTQEPLRSLLAAEANSAGLSGHQARPGW